MNKDMNIELGVDLEEFIRFYVTKETQMIQQNVPEKIYPSFRTDRFSLSNFLALPSLKGYKTYFGPYQHLIGIQATQTPKQETGLFGAKYRFSTTLLPSKYDLELTVSIFREES